MSDWPSMSPLRITIGQQGAVTVDGIAGVQVETVDATLTIEGQPVRDWRAELRLPKHFETLEGMAKPRGYSWRRVTFIVGDESPTYFPVNWREHPRSRTYAPSGHLLTLAHLPFVIGICQRVWSGSPDDARGRGRVCPGGCVAL